MNRLWKQFDYQNAKAHYLSSFAFCQKEYISSAKVSLTGDMKWNFTSGVQPLHFRREGCRLALVGNNIDTLCSQYIKAFAISRAIHKNGIATEISKMMKRG